MKWALKRERADREEFTVAFANLTQQQAARLLLVYRELEKEQERTVRPVPEVAGHIPGGFVI